MKHLFAAGLLVGFSAFSASAQVNLTAETSGAGSVPQLAITHLGQIAQERGIATLQIADGQTLTNSVQNVAEGRTDIASAPHALGFLLSKGRGPYSKLGEEKGAELAGNLRLLYPYRFGAQTLYAYVSSGISGWDDLEGRRILNGPPRGAALVKGRAMIQLISGLKEGEGYTGVQVNWGQAVSTVVDGTAEAAVLPTNFPDARATQALSAGELNLWSFPKAAYESEAMQRYMDSPGNGPFEIPVAETGFPDGINVISDDDIFRSVATVGGDIVHKDMPLEVAKALTAAHIATLPDLLAKAPFAPTSGFGETDRRISAMCGANPVPYHAGAVAAWEEAGYEIPDCAKPES